MMTKRNSLDWSARLNLAWNGTWETTARFPRQLKTCNVALFRRTAHNKSLDASGGSVFHNFLAAAEDALIRAAASTQPFGVR